MATCQALLKDSLSDNQPVRIIDVLRKRLKSARSNRQDGRSHSILPTLSLTLLALTPDIKARAH